MKLDKAAIKDRSVVLSCNVDEAYSLADSATASNVIEITFEVLSDSDLCDAVTLLAPVLENNSYKVKSISLYIDYVKEDGSNWRMSLKDYLPMSISHFSDDSTKVKLVILKNIWNFS